MPATTHADWTKKAAEVRPRTEAFIGGRSVPAVSGVTFDTVDPATGRTLAAVASCDLADVAGAVAAARSAFDSGRWSRAPLAERKAKLLRFADLMEANAEELALLDSLDMGKRVVDAYELDLPFSCGLFRYYAEAIDKISGEVAPTGPEALATVTRVPLGVVGAVIPWNYPVDMVAWKVAPALAAGNAVVLKPAEQSPLSALRLAELAVEAGIPDGVFNVVPGFGETAGEALGRHHDVDCLAFTGSTEIGKRFLTYAGESNLKQVWLECGGKSPNLVFADTDDLEAAARQACFDIFFNQGEVCSAHSRLLVQREIHDELLALLVGGAAQYRPGDPLDPASGMGALVDESHAAKVLRYVEDGRKTATLAYGGNQVRQEHSGCFVEPTVFCDVDNGSALAQDEVFGPVLAVIPFDDEDDAVKLANETSYGLAASVWTGSIARAHRVTDRLVAGTVTVNAVDAFSAQTPFGGFKGSGFGRDLSLHALDKYTGLKTTWFAR